MADSTSGNLTLPSFVTGNTYMLKGETLQAIMDVIKENKVVLTGKKKYDEVGPDGSKLNLDDIADAAAGFTVKTGFETEGDAIEEVAEVRTIVFDSFLFELFRSPNNGEVVVKPITVECACDGGDIDGGDEE